MEKQRHHILSSVATFLSVIFIGVVASAKTPEKKTRADDITSAKMLILDRGSRAQMASQNLSLNRTGVASRINLQTGTILDGYSIKLASRKVSVDSKENFLWLEATLLDPAEKTVAYMTATLPQEKFSLGVGFPHPKDPRQQLVFMIDNTTQ